MVKPEIIHESPISMADLKDELKKVNKKEEKLNFRVEKTQEYLNQFTVLDLKKSQELKEKLNKLSIPRLKEEHIVKIVDLRPSSAEEVKSALSGYTITVTGASLKKIADCLKDFK